MDDTTRATVPALARLVPVKTRVLIYIYILAHYMSTIIWTAL